MNMDRLASARVPSPNIANYIKRYERMYDCALSSSPRLEIVVAAFVSSLALGLFYCVLIRMGTDIRPDFGMLALWFLGALFWNLRAPSAMAPTLCYEGVMRATWATRFQLIPLIGNRVVDRAAREIFLVGFVVLIIAISATLVTVVDAVFPTVFVRHVPYSGGG